MNGISQSGAYGGQQQYGPQGIFGSLLGGPVGGLIGRGIGGLFGNAGLGNQIGQLAGGIGGSILPFGADPMQAYAQQLAQQQQMQQLQQLQQQQQQLSPQGWLGNLIGQVGQPLGGAIGGLFGQPAIGSQIGGIAGQLGRLLPFQSDPMQQAQQAYGQQQLAPQGMFGNLIGQLGQPLGGAIGSIFGQPAIGSQIGGIASQLGRLLPFQADPMQQAMVQQQIAQQIQQLQQLQQLLQQQQQQQPYASQGQQNYSAGQTLH